MKGSSRRWSTRTPDGELLEVLTTPKGWRVVLGGFSQSGNESLAAALAEATGAKRDAPWIRELTRVLETGPINETVLGFGSTTSSEGPP